MKAVMILALLGFLSLSAFAEAPPTEPEAIPFHQLGAEAQKQYSGDGIGITPPDEDAAFRVRAMALGRGGDILSPLPNSGALR